MITLRNGTPSIINNATRHQGTVTRERQLAHDTENPRLIQKLNESDRFQKQP